MGRSRIIACLFFGISVVYSGSSYSFWESFESFNAIIFGDFNPPSNSSSEGRMVVQGNMLVAQYGMSKTVPVDDTGVSVLVGGNLTFDTGRVYGGDILVGGSASGVTKAVLYSLESEQVLLDNVDIPFDFVSVRTDMIDYSQRLVAASANGRVSEKYGNLYMYGDCSGDIQVFNISGEQLAQASSIKVSCVPEASAVLINISGTSVSVSNLSLRGFELNRSRTLYNFYEALDIEFSDISIQGSVLAPLANIKAVSGTLYGTVVAGSWFGSMTLKMADFQGLGELDVVCNEGLVSSE